MQQVIVDALKHEGIVIRNNDGDSSCKNAGSSRVKSDKVLVPHGMRSHLLVRRRVAAPLWITAALLVLMCGSEAGGFPEARQAQSGGGDGKSVGLSQTGTAASEEE